MATPKIEPKTDARPMTNEYLPSGWAFATVEDVAEPLVSGFASGAKGIAGGLRHLRMNNITDQCALNLGLIRTVPRSLRQERYLVQPGDTLCCTTNSGRLVGKVCLFDQSGEWAFSNHLTRVRPIKGIVDPRWLYYGLRRLWESGVYQQLTRNWVNQSTLPKEQLASCEIPVPPLLEQERIVAKVEALLARVNAARERLARVRGIMKRFRQSVLSAACSEGDEAELDTILESVRYGTAMKCSTERKGTPVLRIPNVIGGVISHENMKYGPLSAKEKIALQLEPGDLLMIRSNGSVALVGRTAIVTDREKGFSYAGYLMRLRLRKDLASPEYVNVALQAYEARVQVEMPARSTSGVHNINSGEVRKLTVRLPSLQRQCEIVRRVEALFKLADQVERRVSTAAARADILTQSILAKAFRGELVPIDAKANVDNNHHHEHLPPKLEPVHARPTRTRSKRQRVV